MPSIYNLLTMIIPAEVVNIPKLSTGYPIVSMAFPLLHTRAGFCFAARPTVDRFPVIVDSFTRSNCPRRVMQNPPTGKRRTGDDSVK